MFDTKFYIRVLLLSAAFVSVPSIAYADATQNGAAGATQSATAASTTVARLDALQQGVREIDSRTKVIRVLMERAEQRLRRHSRRALAIVDLNRTSIVARLELFQVNTTKMDEPTIQNMETLYKDSIKVLKNVETWYQTPRKR